MRSRPILACMLCALLTGLACGSAAGAERARDNDARGDQAAPRPEHRQRRLPDDVFKPSEEVGEDHPVPFPVDI